MDESDVMYTSPSGVKGLHHGYVFEFINFTYNKRARLKTQPLKWDMHINIDAACFMSVVIS